MGRKELIQIQVETLLGYFQKLMLLNGKESKTTHLATCYTLKLVNE